MVLTEKFICNCGYNSFSPESTKEVLFCYNDIMMVHQKVIAGWVNSRSGWSGPSVEYILEKALVNFPVLHYPVACKTVDFYNKLQKLLAGYLLPLMPFDLIKLSFNFEGLCPPSLGTHRYAEIGTALMEVLPRLLPTTNADIQSAIAAVGFESNNGFDLLWRILELAVPGFDPTVPILPPVWHQDSKVLKFHQSYLLYFQLQSKKNTYFDACLRTSIFLHAIPTSDYTDIVTLLQTQVDMYRNPDDEGYLPQHLWLNGIATAINNNYKTRVWDVATPRVRRTDGATFDWDMLADGEQPYCHVQGFTPCAFCLDQGRDRVDNNRDYGGRRELDRRGSPGFRDCGSQDCDRGGPPSGRQGDAPQGRSIRPDQRHRPYIPNVICAACKRHGHPASSCDMLAIALSVERHKKQLSESEKLAIKETWVARWKDKVGQPARTARQVIRAYCNDLYISVDHLADAMDWDCWPEATDDDVADE
jgi:hypothetical protein